MKIIVLISMLYLHILDDFKLQGILANFKQKEFWEKNYPDELYKYDYIVSLFIYALQWAISVSIPIIVYLYFNNMLNVYSVDIGIFILGNMTIHAYVDNLKANKHEISLVEDQIFHLLQIIVTWLIFVK